MSIRYQEIDGKKQLCRVRFSPEQRRTIMNRSKDSRGTTYVRMWCGTVYRESPARPWRGKSERRIALKLRRLARNAGIQ